MCVCVLKDIWDNYGIYKRLGLITSFFTKLILQNDFGLLLVPVLSYLLVASNFYCDDIFLNSFNKISSLTISSTNGSVVKVLLTLALLPQNLIQLVLLEAGAVLFALSLFILLLASKTPRLSLSLLVGCRRVLVYLCLFQSGQGSSLNLDGFLESGARLQRRLFDGFCEF